MRHKVISALVVAVLSFACVGLANADNNEEANSALVKKFYAEVVNKGNVDLLDEILAENFIEHETMPGQEPGREGVKQFFETFRTAFPDLKFDVERLIAKDDNVVAYLTISGTNKGEFMGMPATGKKINMKAIDIIRIKDGKVVEHWGVTDNLAMMQQLGAVPEESPAK